eukprot:COSAG01_NODE_2143_length_8317_cov_24.964103_9_plen_98_part_00
MRSCRRAPAVPSSCEPSGNSNAAVATRCRASLVRVVCAGGGSFSSYKPARADALSHGACTATKTRGLNRIVAWLTAMRRWFSAATGCPEWYSSVARL